MARVSNLIEKHMVLWELKRRLADLGQRPGRCMANNLAYGPCLLVSRERGSGGSHVARLAGECLGWQVFDREILDEIAQLAHVRLQLTESLDVGTRSKMEAKWVPELKPEDIGYESYLRYLRQVVMTLGHHGDVVMVGRGAQYLLPSQCALRVRVVAPLELRVERVAKGSGLPTAQVQAEIEKFDSDRAAFVRNCFRREASSPLNYDLVLNTGEVSIEAAADITVLALRNKLGVQLPV